MGEEGETERLRGVRPRVRPGLPFVAPSCLDPSVAEGVDGLEAQFMQRALDLARRPLWTSPNPRVGCVLVRNEEIISEGHHTGSGKPHAEVDALRGIDASGATLYVNLEPCSHFGKMPPCAPVIADAEVEHVVIAHLDPDLRVSGKGVAMLRERGVGVSVGLLEDEAKLINAPYLHHRQTGRAFLTLKLAMSLDGRLSAPDGSSQWITGEVSRARVQARRAEADAVMVGAGTVLIDDPSLSARPTEELRQPLRVLVDGRGRVPADARSVTLPGSVLIVTSTSTSRGTRGAWEEAGAEVLLVDDEAGELDLEELLVELGRRDIVEVICEGGGELATRLLAQDLVERLEFFYGPVLLGTGGTELGGLGVTSIEHGKRFALQRSQRLGDDVLVVLGRSA